MGDQSNNSAVRVAICIPTFKRPVGLSRLLQSFRHLTALNRGDVAVEVVVVDNDDAGSAREVVCQESCHLPLPVRYEIEPQRGVSHVRNRLVRVASDCDLIAFIDDDEHVCPEWLTALLDVQQETGAEIVLGPVVPDFPEDTPQWIVDGRFFNWPRYPTGSRVGFGETSTGLYKQSIFEGTTEPFDTRFALTGSEDTMLFMRVLKEGGTIVWADEAVAYEVVPKTRASARWILKRAYRGANSFTRCEYTMNPGARIRLSRLLKGVAWMAAGAIGLPVTLLRGKAVQVLMLTRICKGAGMIMGVLGHRYEEYHQVHGG